MVREEAGSPAHVACKHDMIKMLDGCRKCQCMRVYIERSFM